MNQNRQVKRAAVLLLFILTFLFVAWGFARPRQKVNEVYVEQVCGRCHGSGGATDNSNMPILAGQNTGYLINQLENFRSGFRRSSAMGPLLKDMDDDALVFIADYYNRAGGGTLKKPDSVPQ